MLKGAKVRIAAALLLINGGIAEGMHLKNVDETADESVVERQIANLITQNEDLFEIKSLLIQQLFRDINKNSKEEKLLLANKILRSLKDVQQRMLEENRYLAAEGD